MNQWLVASAAHGTVWMSKPQGFQAARDKADHTKERQGIMSLSKEISSKRLVLDILVQTAIILLSYLMLCLILSQLTGGSFYSGMILFIPVFALGYPAALLGVYIKHYKRYPFIKIGDNGSIVQNYRIFNLVLKSFIVILVVCVSFWYGVSFLLSKKYIALDIGLIVLGVFFSIWHLRYASRLLYQLRSRKNIKSGSERMGEGE